MKNLKQLCATLFIACACTLPARATQYCSTPVNAGGHAMNVTCEHIGANYIMTFELTGSETFYSFSSGAYGTIDGSGNYNYVSYGAFSNGNKVATFTFPGRPTGFTGSTNLVLVGNSSGYLYYAPTDAEWGTCGPKTMYFVNSWGWETPYVYLYKNGSSEKNANWPGQTLATAGATQISTTCTGAPVYQIDYDSKYDRVIFNNGSDAQKTSNLVIYEGRFYNSHPNGQYDADEWYYSNNFSLVGTFNSWNAATNPFSEWTSGSTVVSTTVHLAAGSYEFKIRQRDRTGDYGNNGTITGDVNCWFMSPNEGNCHLTTTIESDYTFTYDFAANRLSVAFPETVPPCMSSVSEYSTGSNSAVLNVSATDGDRPTPTTFRVSTSSSFASYTDYGATTGRITVTGLAPCTGYTLYVAAIDANGNVSTANETASCQYQSVTFTTTASDGNLAQGKTATVSHIEDAGKTANYAVDGDRGTRWATGNGHNGVENWIQVDLGSVQVVNSVRIYWENAYSRNYQILFSYDGSNYYSVYHQTTDPSRGNGVNDYQNHPLACPTPTRYVKVQAALGSYATDYGLSIWELEIYGSASCAGLASTPHMLCAETVSVGTDEAVIAVSSVDAETAPQNMKYIVSATSGEAGHKQLTSVYTFTASQYIAGTLKHLKVGGLLPDVPYSLSITAVDAADVASDNSLVLNFRTAAGGGACTWEDNEKQDCAGSQDFSEGYTVSIENNTPDDDHFTITTTLNDTKSGLVVYFQRIPNLAGDACGVVGEQQMNLISGQTYSVSVDKSELPDEIDFRIKFAYAGGLANTKPIRFDKNATCSSGFVIYHYDDAPTSTAETSSDASSISEPILYYRHFTPDAFEDVTFPFAIDSVRIYDTGDHQYYKLTAQYKDGTTRAGNFYLRVFPSAGSNGESFTNSWADGTYALPQKNTAYSIRFPNTGGYYANKYILFHGHPGTIETSLILGDRPTTDDLYKVYPNPTMSAQSLSAKAYVTTDRSENLYWKEDNATVQAFETYVLANENTMKRMRRIAAWSEGDDTPTSIEDVRDAMAIHACIAVYSLTGQKIGEWHNCSFGDAEDALALRAQKGCYILVSEGQTRKMIIQ